MITEGKTKIAIIGPYPPPYGGISVHLARIMAYLPENSYHFYNISKEAGKGRKFYGIWKYLYLMSFFFKPYKVIHYHSTSKKVRLCLSIISYFKSNVFLHLHGESFTDAISKKGITAFLLKKLIPTTNFIASNDELYAMIQNYNPRTLYNFDAFLPPKFDQEVYEKFNSGFQPSPTKYKAFMVGWFSSYKNEDLYGFDIALDALRLLRDKHSLDLSIIASVNGIRDRKRYNEFIKTRKALNLDDCFILLEDSLDEVYPLYLKTDIFIRPTNTDGNSVSIKEALWYGNPVIASDCVIRPEKTTLFENRNAIDLAEKILDTVRSTDLLSSSKKLIHCKTREFYYPLIKEIYGLEQ